ncbi:hypothetical protein [Streptomyces sp. NPDC002403]
MHGADRPPVPASGRSGAAPLLKGIGVGPLVDRLTGHAHQQAPDAFVASADAVLFRRPGCRLGGNRKRRT